MNKCRKENDSGESEFLQGLFIDVGMLSPGRDLVFRVHMRFALQEICRVSEPLKTLVLELIYRIAYDHHRFYRIMSLKCRPIITSRSTLSAHKIYLFVLWASDAVLCLDNTSSHYCNAMHACFQWASTCLREPHVVYPVANTWCPDKRRTR